VHSKCSCPDPKNPCKHIAAVYYQLGDFFREDPFVLFQLRGRSRDSILEALRQRRQSSPASAAAIALDPVMGSDVNPIPSHSPDLQRFWIYAEPLDSELVVITPAETTVLDVLGKMPLPPEDAPMVMEHLRSIYQSAAHQALMQALG
jgi:uncharacterized Zn finger protein